MKRFKLPNVRNIFIPDPGYTIAEVDLSGADAQVVAWDAGDEELKATFRRGENIHERNCRDIFGEVLGDRNPRHTIFEGAPSNYTYYDCAKRAVHATNYVVSARTLAMSLGWPISVADNFKRRWFQLHPAIQNWHRRLEHQLQTQRRVQNAWGYYCPFFSRVEGLLPEACAWIAQSTVAITCSKGWAQIAACHFTTPLLQVHDSVVFQYKTDKETTALKAIKERLDAITIPYPDPLTIPWELKTSTKSWGECEKRNW